MTAAAAVLLALGLALLPGAAHAHALKVFVTVEGKEVVGQAYFGQGRFPVGAAVVIRDPSGTVLAEAKADEQGRFRLAVADPGGKTVFVNAGDGHAREVVLPSLGAVPAASPPSTDDLDTRLQRVILPLEEKISSLEERLWIRDVFGGIGFIVGLCGLLAWGKARRAG